MISLDDIPTAFTTPAGARPSAIVARIRAVRPSRRTVLRGIVIGAAASALVPIDWVLTRREAAAAGNSDSKSEHMTCTPASYDEMDNNWPQSGPAVCYGGFRRGSFPCRSGYHREGSYRSDGEDVESTRLTTNCHGKNAWRWNGWRCSDAMTFVTFDDGEQYSGITIAACQIAPSTAPATDADPAQPRKVIPDLGTSMHALPGIGPAA